MPRSTRRCAPLAHIIGLVTATAVGLAAVASPAGAANASDTSLEKVSTLVEPSVVQVRANFSGLVRDERGEDVTGGRPVSIDNTCSGFIVNGKGYIATSGRCLDLDVATNRLIDQAAERAFKEHPELGQVTTLAKLEKHAQRAWTVVSPKSGHRERPDRTVTATSDLLAAQAPDGDALNVSVRRVRGPENGDVALIKVQAKDPLPALELATDADIQPGIQAVSVGFRGSANDAAAGLGSSFEQGTIGDARTVDDGLNQAFEVKAPISPAMSGGPTVDLEGRVLGVNRSRSTRETQPFGLMSPASEITQLLQDVGAPNDLGDASRAYRSALDAFFRGDRVKALAGFSQTLKIQPKLKQAEQFQSRAEELPAPKERKHGGGWMELLPILMPSGGVPALLGLLFGLRRRRRNRPDEPPTVTSAPEQQVAPQRDSADGAPALVRDDGSRVVVMGELVIGRQGADLVLDDDRVSRRHAVVRTVDGGLVVEDLHSANGTSVNGVAIGGPKRLRKGDVIQLGGVRLAADVAAASRNVTVLAINPNGPHLRVTNGPLADRRFVVGDGLIIGRQNADLLLDDPQVSRRHAVVRAVDGELEIEDLGSANGTFVNGARVESPRRLSAGDEIAIGPTVLEANMDDEPDGGSDTVYAAA
jgi:pSer/pThr/pTyr-binding forkhead associated (FHA) protein/S1-C subfamily serine protease